MNSDELNLVFEEINSSIDNQINLITLQISELKNHLLVVEKLLTQIKPDNSF